MRKRCLALSVALLLVAAPGVSLHAQMRATDLSVSPSPLRVSVLRGGTVEETLTVVNLTRDSLAVDASFAALEVDRDGRMSAASSSDLSSAVTWARVEPATFRLDAQHTTTVKVTITAPDDAPAGGSYAALRFAAQRATSGASSESVLGVLVAVGGDAVERTAEVTSVEIPAFSLSSSIPVTLTVENNGDVHVEARGKLVVRDALDRETATVDVPRTIVLPGRSRRISVDVPVPLVPWRVKVATEIGFGRGIPQAKASATGMALPWWGILAWLVVLLVGVRLIVALVRRRRRRRRERASRVVAPLPEVARRAEAWPESAPMPVRAEPIAEPPAEAIEPDFWRRQELEPELFPEPETAAPEPATPEPEPFEPEPSVPEPIEVEVEAEPEPVAPEPVEVEPAVVAPGWPTPAPKPVLVPARTERVAVPPQIEVVEPAAAPVRVLTREKVVEHPARKLSAAAADRRALVALELLVEGTRSDPKLDIGLELLQTVSDQGSVKARVGAAYEHAFVAEDRALLPPLALALNTVGDEGAPEALLRAYGTARGTALERLRAALGTFDPDVLKQHEQLVEALPKTRRSAIGLG